VSQMLRRLFGTDGIRGKVVSAQSDEQQAILALHEQRVICSSLLRVVGEALGRIMDILPGEGNTVVIGWDDRPKNPELVSALTLGLRLVGCDVLHVGLCATPALHRATLLHKARIGCMITASHNPVSDSGLKVFDANGYKTTPQFEDMVSQTADALASEEREIDALDVEELSRSNLSLEGLESAAEHHPTWLNHRFADFQHWTGTSGLQQNHLADPFVVDSSKGAAHVWLAKWLTERGINSIEVSGDARALNFECGAGDFSPTQTWTFDEASTSNHMLLRNLRPAPPGTLVGAALDGDGDRCLVVRATDHGYMVVDGDAMGDAILSASTLVSDRPWHLAASIESDLSLLSTAQRLQPPVRTSETAVGDRWLSKSLAQSLENGPNLPRSIGVEDSGHIVMPTPHPHRENEWALVGDGAASLVCYLLAHNKGNHMKRGWKQRTSISGVDRTKWTGSNALADEVETLAQSFFNTQGTVEGWDRHGLDGEQNLMLIAFSLNGAPVSFGIRNSGTQAKISVSLRLSPSVDAGNMPVFLNAVTTLLRKAMVP
jgi:phosphoglucosamine mutase